MYIVFVFPVLLLNTTFIVEGAEDNPKDAHGISKY